VITLYTRKNIKNTKTHAAHMHMTHGTDSTSAGNTCTNKAQTHTHTAPWYSRGRLRVGAVVHVGDTERLQLKLHDV
jgi:hypothetical protein